MENKTPKLSERYANEILQFASAVGTLRSEEANACVTQIKAAAESKDAKEVADSYKSLRNILHSGAEDENVYGMSIMNGRKKQTLMDLLTPCNIVYGHVYPEDELGSRNVPRRFVFESEDD